MGSTALAVVEQSMMSMDKAVQDYNTGIAESKTHIRRALVTAMATRAIERALTDEVMVEVIIPLADKDYGFLTDNSSRCKNGQAPYTAAELRAAVMSAVLKGAHLVNNEFNVIKGRCYLPKNFFTRKVREFPGLTDLKLNIGVPLFSSANSLGGRVPCSATWSLGGKTHSLDCGGDFSIPVKGRPDDVDAIIGKAERKLLARVYGQLTGSAHDESEPDDFDGVVLDGTVTVPPAAAALPAPSQPRLGAVSQAKELLRTESQARTPAPQRPEHTRATAAESTPVPTAAATSTAAPAQAAPPPPAPVPDAVKTIDEHIAQSAPAAPAASAAKRGRKPRESAPAPAATQAQPAAQESQTPVAAAAQAQVEQEAPADEQGDNQSAEPEATEQTEITITVASVKGLGEPDPKTGKVEIINRFRVMDDRAQKYYTKDRKVAKAVRDASAAGQMVKLVITPVTNERTGEEEDVIVTANVLPKEGNETAGNERDEQQTEG